MRNYGGRRWKPRVKHRPDVREQRAIAKENGEAAARMLRVLEPNVCPECDGPKLPDAQLCNGCVQSQRYAAARAKENELAIATRNQSQE